LHSARAEIATDQKVGGSNPSERAFVMSRNITYGRAIDPDLSPEEPTALTEIEVARVEGLERLAAKSSAVDENGQRRDQLIDGVIFRPTRPVPHEDGTVAEVARMGVART